MTRLQTAGLMGLAGGGAGVLAGMVQAVLGPRMPALTGAKASPVELGILTVVLSLGAVAVAVLMIGRRAPTDGQRTAAAIMLLLVAGVCASTVGLLWIVPGPLLLVAACLVVSVDATAVIGTMSRDWRLLLVSTLGALEVLMALSAAPRWLAGLGILGGLAVVAAPWARRGPWTRRLLLAGAFPFAVLTWWSVVTPVVALLAVALGWRGPDLSERDDDDRAVRQPRARVPHAG
jgi:hypothetical protein